MGACVTLDVLVITVTKLIIAHARERDTLI